MACRMLVGIGKLPLGRLLDDFKLMAQNNNERHEHSDDPGHIQGDGWGIVTGRSGEFECYKNAVPCWRDPKFADLYKLDLDFIMLHARKASPGMAVKYEFTHPFEEDGWYFCHNGTIYDFTAKETSDAQQLFALLLKNARHREDITEAIRTTARSLKEYSALNFILFKPDRLYVLNMRGKRGEQTPHYFTMKYVQADDYVVISSERLQSCGKEWREMQNATLLTLTIPDGGIQIRDISSENALGKDLSPAKLFSTRVTIHH